MKVKVSFDTQSIIRSCLVIIGFVTAIFLIVKARQPLTIIGIAAFLALALNPPVAAIAKRLPGKSRVGGTALAYLMVITILGGALFVIIPPVIEQSSKFASTVPGLIDQASSQRHFVDDFVQRYGLESQFDKAIEDAKSQASNIANDLGAILVNGVTSFFNGLLTMVLILVLTFLMLIEGPFWLSRIWGLYEDPEKLQRHRDVVHKMYRVVVGYVNGQMMVAAIAAACTLAIILLLSSMFPLPANLALPLAAIIFITGLIPMVGATLGAIVVTLILLLNDTTAAIIFLVYFIVYQQIENNFISPMIQSKTVELSALLVLSSILVGVALFGPIGGLISIPIAGCLRVLMIDYLEHTRKKREARSRKNPLAKAAAKLKTK